MNSDTTERVAFVFGAGASHAEGAPLQKDILPFILDESEEIASSEIGRKVRAFLAKQFAWDKEERVYPSLEAVFAFLDYLIYRNESLGGEFTHQYIRDIRESLIKLVHYCVGKVSVPRKGVYRKFWERVDILKAPVTVFTTNYDTFIDEAFEFLNPDHVVLDYCLDLMNSDRYAAGHSPVPIKIIKLHGSLNWKFCNCCNQVLLAHWKTSVRLDGRGWNGPYGDHCENLDEESNPCFCPHDGTPLQTLIVPPAHLKILSHPTVNTLINEAAKEIRLARKIVFIGYSFPEADVHLKVLFKKNLREATHVVVIDQEPSLKLQKSYEALAPNVLFLWRRFEDVVEDIPVMEELLRA